MHHIYFKHFHFGVTTTDRNVGPPQGHAWQCRTGERRRWHCWHSEALFSLWSLPPLPLVPLALLFSQPRSPRPFSFPFLGLFCVCSVWNFSLIHFSLSLSFLSLPHSLSFHLLIFLFRFLVHTTSPPIFYFVSPSLPPLFNAYLPALIQHHDIKVRLASPLQTYLTPPLMRRPITSLSTKLHFCHLIGTRKLLSMKHELQG